MGWTAKYELVQDRLGGPLDSQLRRWREAGVSAPAMARLLSAETRVAVSAETVRRWMRDVGVAA